MDRLLSVSKESVREIIESVRDAVGKECWIPALATALTLPDIMGQVEFPEMVFKSGKRKVGDQYMAWFAKHIERHFTDTQGWDEDDNSINPYFTTDMCWQLRCTVLHQGNDGIKHEFNFENEEDSEYRYTFELRANACNSFGATWPSPRPGEKRHKTVHVCVDVGTLCSVLCDEAERFLASSDDDFSDAGIHIVDVSRFAELTKRD